MCSCSEDWFHSVPSTTSQHSHPSLLLPGKPHLGTGKFSLGERSCFVFCCVAAFQHKCFPAVLPCVAVEWATLSAQGRSDCSAEGGSEKGQSTTLVGAVGLNLFRPITKPHNSISPSAWMIWRYLLDWFSVCQSSLQTSKKKEAKQKDQPNKPDCGGSQSSGYNKMFQKLLYGAII